MALIKIRNLVQPSRELDKDEMRSVFGGINISGNLQLSDNPFAEQGSVLGICKFTKGKRNGDNTSVVSDFLTGPQPGLF